MTAQHKVMTVRTMDDGALHVDEFPDMLVMSSHFLAMAPLIEAVITIRAANGTHRYRVTEAVDMGRSLLLERLPDADGLLA